MIDSLDDYILEFILLFIPTTIPNIVKTSKRLRTIVENNHILKKFIDYDGRINNLLVDSITNHDVEFLKYVSEHNLESPNRNNLPSYVSVHWIDRKHWESLLFTMQLCRYQPYLSKRNYFHYTKKIHNQLDIQTYQSTTCVYNIRLFDDIPFPTNQGCKYYKNATFNCNTGCLTFIDNNVITVFTVNDEKLHHPDSVKFSEFNKMDHVAFILQIYNPINILGKYVIRDGNKLLWTEDVRIPLNCIIEKYQTNFLIMIDTFKYIFIGNEIIEFKTHDAIIDFESFRNKPIARDSMYVYVLSLPSRAENKSFVKLLSKDISEQMFRDEIFWRDEQYMNLHLVEMKARII